jgi:cell division initiation protein
VTLDKIDLIDRKFSKSLLGYSRDDVDRLVAEAADTIGRLAEEKMALARAVEELRREVEGYRARETTLRDTLLTTQTIVEDVKAKARREAEGLLDQARDQAEALVGEAGEKARGLSADIDALVQRKTALTTRFRDMLMAALDILDAQEAEDEAASGAESLNLSGGCEPADLEAPERDADGEGADDFSFVESGGPRP